MAFLASSDSQTSLSGCAGVVGHDSSSGPPVGNAILDSGHARFSELGRLASLARPDPFTLFVRWVGVGAGG